MTMVQYGLTRNLSTTFMNIGFLIWGKKCEVCKIMCCYVGLNYLVVDEFLWICDSMDLLLYRVIANFEEIEMTIFL